MKAIPKFKKSGTRENRKLLATKPGQQGRTRITSESDIIRRPIISEKSSILKSVTNSVAFEVSPDATKTDIRQAVQALFNVKVKWVRTLNVMGKEKRVGTKVGRQRSWKKAYVGLAEGSTIEVVEGL